MENTETRKRYDLDRIARIVIAIISIVAAIYVINYLSGILLPFVIGGLLAYMLNPLVEWLMRVLHVKGRALPSILAIILAVAVLTLVFWWLIPYIGNEVSDMTKMLTNYAKASFKIPHIPDAVQDFFRQNFNPNQWQKLLTKEQWMNLINQVASGTWSVLGGTVSVLLGVVTILLVLMYMFFILLDYDNTSTLPPHQLQSYARCRANYEPIFSWASHGFPVCGHNICDRVLYHRAANGYCFRPLHRCA